MSPKGGRSLDSFGTFEDQIEADRRYRSGGVFLASINRLRGPRWLALETQTPP